jgi:hypothetical protein
VLAVAKSAINESVMLPFAPIAECATSAKGADDAAKSSQFRIRIDAKETRM